MRLRTTSAAAALFLTACGDAPPRQAPAGPTPDSFRVAFATSKGTFVLIATMGNKYLAQMFRRWITSRRRASCRPEV